VGEYPLKLVLLFMLIGIICWASHFATAKTETLPEDAVKSA